MIADLFDVFLLDLDGVVRLGEDPLPGAVASIAELRRCGKGVRFLTNDPRPTRAEVAQQLTRLGIPTGPGEVVTSGWATGAYLRHGGVTRVHVLGSSGLAEELSAAGLEVTDQDPQAVVVGCDETLGYGDIRLAVHLIRAGARFVATNTDATFPTPDGPWPATGAIVAAVQTACGAAPRVVGKPAPTMFKMATADLDPTARVVMVGDTPQSDILGAHRAGIPAVLVTTDTPSQGPRTEQDDPLKPEAVINDLTGLFAPNATVTPVADAVVPARAREVRAGVAAVVFDEQGRVLLMRRADNGMWGIVSGHVELGETVAHAAAREVAEETGLVVQTDRLVGVYSDPASQVVAYPDGRVCQFVTTSFACHVIGGTLQPDDVEAIDAGFFPVDDLPRPLMPMHPSWLHDALTGHAGLSR